jgi:ABC-type glucose/galactose transport system permease subunit
MSTGTAWANATLAFLLELAALALLAWGGWRLGGGAGALRGVLAVGLPVAAAVLWGLFAWGASPRWGAGFAALVAANLVLAVLLPVVETPAT